MMLFSLFRVFSAHKGQFQVLAEEDKGKGTQRKNNIQTRNDQCLFSVCPLSSPSGAAAVSLASSAVGSLSLAIELFKQTHRTMMSLPKDISIQEA